MLKQFKLGRVPSFQASKTLKEEVEKETLERKTNVAALC